MTGRRRNKALDRDLTEQYRSGQIDDEEDLETGERFNNRSQFAEQNKILRTAAMRAAAEGPSQDIESLRVGQVIQVYSLFCEVQHEGTVFLCVTRKTLTKVAQSQIVVGDRVRIRESGTKDDLGRPEAVIEQVLPRDTILSRADSFKGIEERPIVANADQMLIVASLLQPRVKWGLVDRMIIAAQAGKLQPIVCLNKIDLAMSAGDEGKEAIAEADQVLDHYEWLGVHTLLTSVETSAGLEELRTLLKERTTVLAGHSGVGKSTLINTIQPQLDIRVGEVSEFTDKGRHTTTSARRYQLDFGGAVIDTPGVKVFGLWAVTKENLIAYFPDMANGSAPDWRKESYERIEESLRG